MRMNEIKYLPKSNAFADVYSKATGMPFIGEMMAAAAGNGGNDEKTIWYIAYGDSEGTVETSRGTGEQTGLVDSETGKQELVIITNNNYPELVGQNAWVSEDAAVDDGELWEMDMPLGTASGLYLGFFSEEPATPNAEE